LRVTYRVGTLSSITFAAQRLAYTLRCRGFAEIRAHKSLIFVAKEARDVLIGDGDAYRFLRSIYDAGPKN
jgi:hypothetical protein